MIDHELLWMLFLGSSDRNIRNKMRALLRNMTNKQNKLNSANSLKSILTFLAMPIQLLCNNRPFMKLSATDVMIDHELLWVLFL